MRRCSWIALPVAAMLCAPAQTALAQEKPAPIIEVPVGRSGFIDEVWDYFTTIGGGVRWFVTPRLAVGPEIAYLTGEFDSLEASHISVTGNVTFDFALDGHGRRVVPYIAAGAGYVRQRTLVGRGPGVPGLAPFTSGEGTVSGGIGARIAISSRVFVAPEFRLGWEPTTRIVVIVGLRTR
jgi:opacity protein-like surface antigen